MLLLPVVLILLIGFAVLAVVVTFFARSEDRNAIAASKALVLSSLDVEKREIGYDLDSYAWWNDAVTQVKETMDAQWLDENFGSYQTRSHQIFASFVVDPANKTTVAFLDGKRVQADAFQTLAGGLDRLIASTRASSEIEPKAASGYLSADGRAVIVGAEAITPETADSPLWPKNVPRYVLVFARRIDGNVLLRVGERAGTSGLQYIDAGGPALAAKLPLVRPDGVVAGQLSWEPDLPAIGLILSMAPFVGFVLLGMAGLFLAFLRRAQRIANRLQEQATMIDQIPDAVIATDHSGLITRWSAGAQKMLRYEPREIIGQPISKLLAPDKDGSIRRELEQVPAGADRLEVESPLRRKTGDVFPAHISLAPVADAKGRRVGTIGYALDISRQKQLEAKLEELATVDELTGAYNRRYLQVHGPIEIQRAQRFKRPLAFVMFDLDHFKRINDSHGHSFGDLVLATFAALCRKSLRSSDIFVRYGGEEFLALMPETDLETATRVAKRIADQLRDTLLSTNPPLKGLTVSSGATALKPEDAGLQAPLTRADQALYRAKEMGRDRIETAA